MSESGIITPGGGGVIAPEHGGIEVVQSVDAAGEPGHEVSGVPVYSDPGRAPWVSDLIPKLRKAKREGWAKWIRSAADEYAVMQGCVFDEYAGCIVVAFFEEGLHFTQGRWAGQPFILEPWQRDDIIMPLFGWKRADGTRRFRLAFIEIPKKNGKTTMAAGLVLYLTGFDNEPAAQVFSAALDRKQAAMIWDEADRMINYSPDLRRRFEPYRGTKSIYDHVTMSSYQALSHEAGTKEGLNIHAAIMDEFHVQPNDALWKTLRYGGAARTQPLFTIITTAGDNVNSVCHVEYDRAKRIISGDIVEDTGYFAFIREADPEDDWTDPATWKKANPNFGTIIKEDDLREDCLRAQGSPTEEAHFKRYRLNIWTRSDQAWMPMKHWDACDKTVPPEDLRGMQCWGGLDLSSTTDLTALALMFNLDIEGELYCAALLYYWIPEDNMYDRQKRDRVPYIDWSQRAGNLFAPAGQDGFITPTPGNVVDYGYIRRTLNELKDVYDIQEIAYDRWNSQQLVTQLGEEDGFTMVEFGQGYASMSSPMKELEADIYAGRIVHNNNPVLRWNIQNVVAKMDPAGNIKPDKDKSREKIDGAVAMIMARDRAGRHVVKESVYNTQELYVI